MHPGGIRLDAAVLRIIRDELWEAAHARLQRARDAYVRATGGLLHRPQSRTESRYLLSGFASCAWCRGGLVVRSRDYGRVRRYSYVCAHYHQRGRSVCGNNLEAPLADTDRAVLDAIREELPDRQGWSGP